MNDKGEDKLLNLTEFEDLNLVVASIADIRGELGPYKNISEQGVHINNLEDLIYTNRGIYYQFPDNVLKKVLLYQGERHFRTTDKLDEDLTPTYHIYKCEIVKRNIEQRSKLFKIARKKDGYFLIKDLKFDKNLQRKEELAYYKASICNLCFIMHGRIVRTSIPKEDFNLKEYLEPGYSELTFPYNFDEIPINYKSNWKEIANSLKEKKNYTCEKCGIIIAKLFAEKFLNVHFTSEIIYTRAIDRAKVLCIRCHSDEPGHGHIKEKIEYKNFCETTLKNKP